MKKAIITILAMALFSTMSVGSASALYITGDIIFGGSFVPIPSSTDLASATGIDTISDAALVTGWLAGSDLSIIPIGTSADFFDFNLPSTFVAVEPLWEVGIFTFNLGSVSITTGPTATELTLLGTGTLKGTGYDDTPATWSWSGDRNTGSETYAFSSTTSASAVPEPATMILIGTGLAGLVGTRLRRKK